MLNGKRFDIVHEGELIEFGAGELVSILLSPSQREEAGKLKVGDHTHFYGAVIPDVTYIERVKA